MKERKEPWRIAAFAISVLYIAYLWGKKDTLQPCMRPRPQSRCSR